MSAGIVGAKYLAMKRRHGKEEPGVAMLLVTIKGLTMQCFRHSYMVLWLGSLSSLYNNVVTRSSNRMLGRAALGRMPEYAQHTQGKICPL